MLASAFLMRMTDDMKSYSPPDHLVFVYGTLKQGKRNHHHMERAKLIGKATTRQAYPLIADGLPYLWNLPGYGHNVTGELFRVSNHHLIVLDKFEGHPTLYQREQVTVMVEGRKRPVRAWAYFSQSRRLMPSDRLIAEY